MKKLKVIHSSLCVRRRNGSSEKGIELQEIMLTPESLQKAKSITGATRLALLSRKRIDGRQHLCLTWSQRNEKQNTWTSNWREALLYIGKYYIITFEPSQEKFKGASTARRDSMKNHFLSSWNCTRSLGEKKKKKVRSLLFHRLSTVRHVLSTVGVLY